MTTSVGTRELRVPRARVRDEETGETTEFRSELLPRYARRTREVDEAILGTYLSGTNSRRIRKALKPLLGEELSFIIIDPAGMVPLVALRRTKKPGSARAGTCRDHAINGPRSWTTQSRGTPAIDAQRLNWLRRRRAIRSGGGAHPLAATRRLLRSVMVGA